MPSCSCPAAVQASPSAQAALIGDVHSSTVRGCRELVKVSACQEVGKVTIELIQPFELDGTRLRAAEMRRPLRAACARPSEPPAAKRPRRRWRSPCVFDQPISEIDRMPLPGVRALDQGRRGVASCRRAASMRPNTKVMTRNNGKHTRKNAGIMQIAGECQDGPDVKN